MTADTTNLPVAAPCEHCGSTDIFIEREDLSAYQARCNDCGSRGPIVEERGLYAAEGRRILEEMTALFEMTGEANIPGTDSYTVLWQAREFLRAGHPVALRDAQSGDVTETALDHIRQFVAGMDKIPDAHPISLGLEDGPEAICTDGLDLDTPSPLTLGDLRALSAARASAPAAPEVVEGLKKASECMEAHANYWRHAIYPTDFRRLRDQLFDAIGTVRAALRSAGEAANG